MPSETIRERIENTKSNDWLNVGNPRLALMDILWRAGNLIPADEIVRLRADLDEAREALSPFAKLADAAGVQGCADDADWQIDLLGPRDGPAKGYIGDFTTADLRRARAFIDRGA